VTLVSSWGRARAISFLSKGLAGLSCYATAHCAVQRFYADRGPSISARICGCFSASADPSGRST
jgi:hypothetical protein